MNKASCANSMLHPVFSTIFDIYLSEHSTAEPEPQVRRKCWTPYCSDCGRCEKLQEIVDREG